jgi:hypothetical protein
MEHIMICSLYEYRPHSSHQKYTHTAQFLRLCMEVGGDHTPDSGSPRLSVAGQGTAPARRRAAGVARTFSLGSRRTVRVDLRGTPVRARLRACGDLGSRLDQLGPG